MIHIVMVEPEIPANTGNISRTCAVTGTKLHLIEPLGFEITDKALKRAGLDYWDKLDLEVHKSLEAYIEKYAQMMKNTFLATTKGKKRYTDIDYQKIEEKGEDIFIMFGKETKGLPEELILSNFENAIRIPMKKELRSLNLSNSVNIVLYEILRQIDFKGLEDESHYFDS